MNKITVVSPANIAFIKYWGMKDKDLVLPNNDSYSMNLSHCVTEIVMERYENPEIKEVFIQEYTSNDYKKDNGQATEKVCVFYNRVKNFLGIKDDYGFRIYSKNSFPKKAGIASSASFFSGLALTFVTGFEKKLDTKQLSIVARLSGSGSASRSIPDGFVHWHKGTDSNSSFSESCAPPEHWELCDVVLIVSQTEKKVGSQEGHEGAWSSPLYAERLSGIEERVESVRKAIETKDVVQLGTTIEADTISMHAVMMTQKHPLFYWSHKTLSLLKKICVLRREGLPCYYTIDAGENVHVIVEKKQVKELVSYFARQGEVLDIILNSPCVGARQI
ncbi:diphosphomevalonate decarboxylase [Candidatus Roizmanbacteria bacterium]|nr:diphosphomevalonate decarboxylase [Candidatus Roizmanbacteria bacterium]